MGMSARVPCMLGVATSSHCFPMCLRLKIVAVLRSGEKDFMFFDNVEK